MLFGATDEDQLEITLEGLNRFELRDLCSKGPMIEIGIFGIQFDSRDLTLNLDEGITFDPVSLSDLDGNLSCGIELLTNPSFINLSFFTATQVQY